MVEICTFGDWDIRENGVSILESKASQQKLLRLLQYLITFEGRKITPERIYEDLLSDSDYYDPKNIIRTQISRVRSLFKNHHFYDIEYIAGYYVLNLKDNCVVDFKEFENCISKIDQFKDKASEDVLSLFKQGLFSYGGQYMPDVNDDWIVTIRNRYSRLYLRGIYKYLEFIKEKGKYNEIVEITERAIEHEPYDEMLNLHFIDALIKTGQRGFALCHYEYFTSKLYNDLNINPSDRMKEIYNELQATNNDSLESIFETVNTVESIPNISEYNEYEHYKIDETNPFYTMDINDFKSSIKDSATNNYLLFITLQLKEGLIVSEVDIESNMNVLLGILKSSLRSEDIFLKCKDGAILLLLHNTDLKSLDRISRRLESKFLENTGTDDVTLSIMSKTV